MSRTVIPLILVATFVSTACALPPGFSVIDPSAYKTNLRGDYDWAVDNVPFIDFPDEDLVTAFYYRWTSYKKHIQWGSSPTWSGWVVTGKFPSRRGLFH
jgi:hypothetical protein